MHEAAGSDVAVAVDGLKKRFETVEAVAGISFSIKQGELFGLLGPNGAGKTTTINMLTGLAAPDAGSIHIAGINAAVDRQAAQRCVGVVPDESNLYPELTGFENLCFCAALYGIRKEEREVRARELLAEFGLTEAAGREFGGYSKGMKRKLTIAAGIIHDPAILFLDEPTTGIDVASARRLRQSIDELHKKGTTILLTTHYIEEAERLCDRIAFVVSGRIVRVDTVEELLQPIQSKHILEISCERSLTDTIVDISRDFPDLTFNTVRDNLLRVEDTQPIGVGPLVRFLEDRGVEVSEARRIRPSLEDVFVEITGIEADVMHKEKAGGRR